ncbi:MAG: DUF4864 domain-containing protein, partial [Alphaproteobacteria bacterium]|nr:DUF4864 domain-containing protein [Alphaproteobacteria bacterium]
LLFASLTPAHADAPDQAALQAVISAQLQAFQNDDGPKAYSYAAPVVKLKFPDVVTFMTMVKSGYLPIYKNAKFAFGSLALDANGNPAQHVTITAESGKRYEAVYFMQQQPDGSWKIAGVQMVEIPGLDA